MEDRRLDDIVATVDDHDLARVAGRLPTGGVSFPAPRRLPDVLIRHVLAHFHRPRPALGTGEPGRIDGRTADDANEQRGGIGELPTLDHDRPAS
jgi:hypothetical protein